MWLDSCKHNTLGFLANDICLIACMEKKKKRKIQNNYDFFNLKDSFLVLLFFYPVRSFGFFFLFVQEDVYSPTP